MHIKKIALILILIVCCNKLFSQNVNNQKISEVIQHLKKLNSEYPMQKAYLHTDKDEYISGEDIWLRAYLVDAKDHKPDTNTTNINVDLVNIDGKLVSVNVLRLDKGYSDTKIKLPDSLPEGNYQIRAYTNWMKNFGTRFYFSKDIFVHNPEEANYIRLWDRLKNTKFNRKIERKSEEYQFAFFPEGGNIIENVKNRVAFKATNALGGGVEVSGYLKDDENNKILEFESVHNGMGVFEFTPKKNKRYKAKVKYSPGKKETVRLPSILETGYVLSANLKEDNIFIEVSSNNKDEELSDNIFLIGHLRGNPHFYTKGVIENGVFETKISAEDVQSGVYHITLFDENILPVAERLVFINKDETINEVDVSVHKFLEEDEKKMFVELFFGSDVNKLPGKGYSVSVVGADSDIRKSNSNIATYLLMGSDFGKTIEDPWFYFSDDSTDEIVDLLMMTHGWRRFDWEDILKKETPGIKHPQRKGLTLRGKVDATESRWRTEEQYVELLTIEDDSKEGAKYTTKSDEDGWFMFEDLDYEGVFTAEFTVERDASGRTMNVSLVSEELDPEGFLMNFMHRHITATKRSDKWERMARPETMTSAKKQHSPEQRSSYGTPSQVVYMEDIQTNYSNIMQVLTGYIRGLSVEGGMITLRGTGSLSLTSEPLFIVDGAIVHRNSFLSLNPNDVSRIEVVTGPSTSVYGLRGANGVIIAYTKRTQSYLPATAKYILKGYSSAHEFYQSKIDVNKYIKTNSPKTLFWSPIIIPGNDGKAYIKFPIEDKWNNFRIIVEGIDEKGNITYESLNF